MIHRLQRGTVPDKPHTVFAPEGELSFEHCITRQGFDGAYTIVYHKRPPHWVAAEEDLGLHPGLGRSLTDLPLARRHYRTPALHAPGSPSMGRKLLMSNAEVGVWMVHADQDDETLFQNGDGDELVYVHRGSGRVDSPLGVLAFRSEDYVYVPRGLPVRWRLNEPSELFIVEGRSYIDLPPQARNHTGQLKMDAPFTHRDFRPPVWPDGGPASLGAPRRIVAMRNQRLTAFDLPHDLFDVYGWDGQMWPFAFPIRAFQPRTGLVHLPPTIHTTFVGGGFVVCSFVPRMTDFHEKAIPCPYPHSAPDCDEILFYVAGNFTSRKGIDAGSISLHPAGLPHGPHPGTYEASIGTRRTDEMAVMVDTFRPLVPTDHAVAIEEAGYNLGWVR